MVELHHHRPEQESGGKGDQPAAVHGRKVRTGNNGRKPAGAGRKWRSLRIQRHKHGDLGEFRQTRVERDLAALEQAIGTGLEPGDVADGQARGEYAAEAGGDQTFGILDAGENIRRHELHDAAGRGQRRIVAALITHGPGVVLEGGCETHAGTRDQVDVRGVGMDRAHPADDAAAVDHGRASRDAVIGALADDELLPPPGEVALRDARRFKPVLGVGRQAEELFEACDLGAQGLHLLGLKFVAGIDVPEFASGLHELLVRMRALRPILLQVACVGGGDLDGRLQLVEARPQERFHRHREQDPGEHDDPQDDKGLGLIEAFGGHGQRETLIRGAGKSIRIFRHRRRKGRGGVGARTCPAMPAWHDTQTGAASMGPLSRRPRGGSALRLAREMRQQEVQIAEHDAGAVGDGAERIVGDGHGQARLVAEQAVDTAEQRAAAGHHEAAVDEVGGKLGRAALQGVAHGIDNGGDGVAEGLADFLRGDVDGFRQTGDGVASLDLHGKLLLERIGGADLHLDLLGSALADEEIVGPLHVIDDRGVELVTRHADGFGEHDAGEGDDGDLSGAAADVDDHVGGGFIDRQADADRGGHGFLDGEHLAGTRVRGRFLHGALLNLGDARGDGDDDARRHAEGVAVHLADEVPQHRLRDVEVGDDAILHRTDGLDVAGRAAEHALRLFADRQNLAGGSADGDH